MNETLCNNNIVIKKYDKYSKHYIQGKIISYDKNNDKHTYEIQTTLCKFIHQDKLLPLIKKQEIKIYNKFVCCI